MTPTTLDWEKEFDKQFPNIVPHFLFGNPLYQCYRFSGHEYDERGFCKVCFNPSVETQSKMISENAESEYLIEIKHFIAQLLEEQRASIKASLINALVRENGDFTDCPIEDWETVTIKEIYEEITTLLTQKKEDR